jgi:hypothetical protein
VRSQFDVQEYKEKNLKRKLTISDIKMVSKFAQNSQSLKQIDEELEFNSSESECGDIDNQVTSPDKFAPHAIGVHPLN